MIPSRSECERQLAERLSKMVQARRLARIGEPVPATSVPFERLPDEDQRTWRDVAASVIELMDL